MKLKLTLVCLIFTYYCLAQKEIQPYTLTNKEGKIEETLLIYASAKSTSDITFSLRNEKNQAFENDKNEKVSFKVSPFTETVFKNKLKEAIVSIKSFEGKKDDESIRFNILNNKDNYEKEVRNIYQFFNALIITAFQYDTEPVAGTLKYSLEALVTKNSVDNLETDTETYFRGLSRKIRNKRKNLNVQCTSYIKRIDAIKNKYADHKQKKLIKILKKLYNSHQIDKLLQGPQPFFELYNSEMAKIEFNKQTIKELKKSIDDNEKKLLNLEQKNNDSLKKIGTKIDSLEKSYRKQLNDKNSIKSKIDNIKEWKDVINSFNENEKAKFYTDLIQKLTPPEKTTLQNDLHKINNTIDANNITEYNIKNEEITSLILKKTEDLDLNGEDSLLQFVASKRGLSNSNLENLLKQEKSYVDDLKNTFEKIVNNEAKLKEYKRTIFNINNNNLEIKKYKDSIKVLNKENKLAQYIINKHIASHKEEIKGLPLFNLKINNIELDINNGFIEHITVVGIIDLPYIPHSSLWETNTPQNSKYDLSNILSKFYNEELVKEILGDFIGKEIKFVNEFPIGFSSRTDFEDLYEYQLHHYRGEEAAFSLPVSDVIKMYIQKHQNDRLDFSPKNQVVTLPGQDKDNDRKIELKKEKSSKLLATRIYSDFIGFNDSEPNGIIQMELEKNIPLWTRRFLIRKTRGANYGFLNYINFSFNWARIEDKEEELTINDDTLSYLDLIKFKDISVGVDLNMFTLDIPNYKLRIEGNLSSHYGRTRVINNTIQLPSLTPKNFDENVGFFSLRPDFLIKIRPEERFGGFLRYQPQKILIPRGDDFDGFTDIKNSGQWLHRIELSTFYTPNIKSDNKFFFRYRYTNTAQQETNGFSQFQVGYLAYLKF